MHRIRRLLIEPAALGDELTRQVRQRLPGVPVEVLPPGDAWRQELAAHPGAIGRGKATLLLARQKGPFWRSCPGTKDYLCCGYQVLQVMTNCPLDCTYCVLQGYLNFPAITVFTNLDDLAAEIESRCQTAPEYRGRLGTGEFGDSLALDDLLDLNRRLIPLVTRQPGLLLEIKTKWHRVEPLLPLGPNPRVVFAWSLNPPGIIRSQEFGTASLAARLEAARQCAAAGFRLAFHFDPLIFYPGWETDYQQLVETLGAKVPAAAIAWISLGCLRFMPALQAILRQRFPASRIVEEEFITGLDGKKRYFKGLRLEMYRRMREWLTQALPGPPIYLCMESPAVWQAVFDRPMDQATLTRLLDARIVP